MIGKNKSGFKKHDGYASQLWIWMPSGSDKRNTLSCAHNRYSKYNIQIKGPATEWKMECSALIYTKVQEVMC